MKIKGWEKINGFTYKGYCIVNPIHNAEQTKYMVDVLDLNTPQKTKWELSVLMPDFKFKQDNDITIILWDENKYRATKSIPPEFISEIKGFRMIFEDLVNELLKIRLISSTRTASSHSLNSGIVNHINNNGNTIQWQSVQAQALKAAKDLQDQIDKLNTPLTPF